MLKFTVVEQVVHEQKNQVLPLPPDSPPISPFPVSLSQGQQFFGVAPAGPLTLAKVKLDLTKDRDGVLLLAVVNWSAFCPAGRIAIPVVVEADFEILRNGTVIYAARETILAPAVGVQLLLGNELPADTGFSITSLRHFDTGLTTCPGGLITYTLQINNVAVFNAADTQDNFIPPTVAIGAVTLVAKEIAGRQVACGKKHDNKKQCPR